MAGDPEALLGHQLQLLDLRLANATAVLSLEVCANAAVPACSTFAMPAASQRAVPSDVGSFWMPMSAGMVTNAPQCHSTLISTMHWSICVSGPAAADPAGAAEAAAGADGGAGPAAAAQ